MGTLEDLTKDLIAELARIQAPGALVVKGPIGIPGQIAAGDNQFILTSDRMESLIDKIADELKQKDQTLAVSHTAKEWRQIVRRAFGPALAAIDFDYDRTEAASVALATVQSAVTAISNAASENEHAYGCTLFGRFDVDAFEIGPVRFEPRDEWLGRKAASKHISAVTSRRIAKTWAGKKFRARKNSFDSFSERGILAAVEQCPYVCSVATKALGSEAARLKSQAAAHLAMVAIALRWVTPSSALQGFNLQSDAGVRRQYSLVFQVGRRTLTGGNLIRLPHGPSVEAATWAAELQAHRVDFDVVGEAIEFFLTPDGASTRPKMMNTLCQALLWFYEGCREEVDLMGVVKFAATLDALAAGRQSNGICKLITARLGIAEGDTIRKGGPTMKAAINQIYSDGRSRTIHGTNNKIGHDWTSTRSLAEQFARLCLIACIDWMVNCPTSDDILMLQK